MSWVLVGLTGIHADAALASESAVRETDQIWLASSRALPHDCGADSEERMRFSRYQGECDWASAEEKMFQKNGADTDLTLFFVHGNQVSASEARHRGLMAYRALVAHAEESTRIRFVIYSWPSEQVRGKLRDVRFKAQRTSAAGVYLGRLLNRIEPQTEVSLAGFSFGARVITGALHVADGGALDGRKLDHEPAANRKPINAVLMSAALDSNWLEPNAYHSQALTQAGHVLLMTNPCDPAMRWYHLLDRCTKPCALGYAGVASYEALGDDAVKIEQLNVQCQIGRAHDLALYLCQPSLMASAWDTLRSTTRVETKTDAKPTTAGMEQQTTNQRTESKTPGLASDVSVR